MSVGKRCNNKGEHGGTLLEFTITAATFLMMLVGIVAIGHLYFTHNALVEATRRGARYASMQCNSADGGYYDPNGGSSNLSIAVLYK